jgi:hypothetical protein
VCPIPGNNKSSHDNVVIPGWAKFISLFGPP